MTTTKPTAEQIEAAKARLGDAEFTLEHAKAIVAFGARPQENGQETAGRILLAALEAAEELAEIGRLAVESRRAFYDVSVPGDVLAAMDDNVRSKLDAYLGIDRLTPLGCAAKEPMPPVADSATAQG